MEKVEVIPVIGLPQLAGWSQVVTNQEQTLVCAVAVSGQHAGNVGRDLVDELRYLTPTSSAQLYAQVTKLIRDVHQKNCQVSLLIASLQEGRGVFLAAEGMILLQRNQKLGKVLAAQGEPQLIEGSWRPDDIFILLTQQAYDFVDEIQQKLGQGFDEETVVTSLVPNVHSHPQSSLQAVAFVQKKTVAVAEVEESEESQEESSAFDIDIQVGEPPVVTSEVAKTVPSPTWAERLQPIRGRLAHVKNSLPLVIAGVKSGWRRVGSLLPSSVSREVYVSAWDTRRVARVVVPILLVLLVIGGAGGYYWYQRQTARTAVQAQIAPLLEAAQTQRQQAESDPVTARSEMQLILDQLRTLEEQSGKRYGVSQLLGSALSQVQTAYDEISGLEEVSSLEPFFDLRLVEGSFIASEVLAVDEQLYFLDQEQKQVIVLNTQTKEYQVFSLDDRSDVRDLAIGLDNQVLILADGVFGYNQDGGEATELVAADEQVRASRLLTAFNEAIYVLSPEKQNIYRYRPNEEGEYEVAVGWIRAGESIDFETVKSMAIDGDIWLSTQTGEVYRYNSGRQTEFSITGLTQPLAETVFLSTQLETEAVALLEASRQRVVTLDKTGNFLKEIKSSSLAAANGIALAADGKTAYVINGSIVYAIEL